MRVKYIDKNKTIYSQQVHPDSDVVISDGGKAYSARQLIDENRRLNEAINSILAMDTTAVEDGGSYDWNLAVHNARDLIRAALYREVEK